MNGLAMGMIYQVQRDSDRELSFATHPGARRGRGILYAMAPLLLYVLAICVLFALATRDLSLWSAVKTVAVAGLAGATALGLAGFALGHRVRDRIDVDADSLQVRHTPGLGPERVSRLSWNDLVGLAIDPTVRSLGADVKLVAVHRDGRRIALAEGEPHSGQLRELAVRMSMLGGIPLQAPRFTRSDLVR